MEILPHYQFVDNLKKAFQENPLFIGIAVGGSYLSNQLDEYSDLDIYLVVSDAAAILDFDAKKEILATVANPLCCYTNGHDARVIICLYQLESALLHVDWKWLTLKEFEDRVENPAVIFEHKSALTAVIARTESSYPKPDIERTESRFWSWIHYVLSKIGRGELLEASDYLSEVRTCCVGPLLLHKNGLYPRRMRHAEDLPRAEWALLDKSIQKEFSKKACFEATMGMIKLYQYIRKSYLCGNFQQLTEAETACLAYADYIGAKL